MATSPFKEAKRGLRRTSGAFLHSAVHAPPTWLGTRFASALCYVEMLLIDYGIVRMVYNNRHRVGPDTWRSAQPAPHHIAWAGRRGVRTVINLRGEQSYGTRWLEQQACARQGIKLVDLTLKSRAAPTRAEFAAMKDVLGKVEYPILVHCKSGADRAGLMSVMISHLHDGLPIRKALNQLSLRYGHVRSADTGVLDAVFHRYLADEARTGIAFWDWVETVYDPREMNSTFKARGWANRLVNNILHRE
ncbi:sulfur transferase domain-containing protein [Hyphomicrobium sp.]|uniref:fused DSP-PTPase phosphatase/NAD kinase-like protein n=1 Tax=Hyphomicrobium sp. TaxID=82 RepID=UPI000F9C118C|nr:sulfur transferase domain-containing protein [Hyphomicrobium sp.]RUP08149.1 MAG: protein tyrosine phosphatase [Hyphomicrobium sp.]